MSHSLVSLQKYIEAPLFQTGLAFLGRVSVVLYSCLFSNICAAYADVELFVLIHVICSLNLTFKATPDWPTYSLLHVLHFNLYIALGLLYICLSENCCCIALIARKTTFRFVCLNKLITRLIRGLKFVNVTHFFI
jgi:hypothetical protein